MDTDTDGDAEAYTDVVTLTLTHIYSGTGHETVVLSSVSYREVET